MAKLILTLFSQSWVQNLYPGVFPPLNPFCKFRAWSTKTSSSLVVHPQWWSVAFHQDFPHIIWEGIYITELKIASSALSIRKHSLSKCVLVRGPVLVSSGHNWDNVTVVITHGPFSFSLQWMDNMPHEHLWCPPLVPRVKWERKAFGDNFSHFYFFLVGSFLSLVPSLYRWGTRT